MESREKMEYIREINFVLFTFKFAVKNRYVNNAILNKEGEIFSNISSLDLIGLLKTNTVKKKN